MPHLQIDLFPRPAVLTAALKNMRPTGFPSRV